MNRSILTQFLAIIILLIPFSFTYSQSITSLTLINADTDQDISPLVNGQTLNLSALPTRNLNVRANTSPSKVGSVRFAYDANTNYNTENEAPYALADNPDGNYRAWTPSTGNHTLKVTAYSGAKASGTAGTAYTVNFSVSDNASKPASGISGELKKWHRVTLTLDGPSYSETSSSNPFLNYRFNVVFTHSSGKSYKVPGYFAADGNAGETGATSGSKWRAHFSPDETGTWNYVAYCRQGTNVALSDDDNAGTAVTSLNGKSGSFTISASDKTGKDLRAKGRLRYVDAQYLQFAETGEYFRKAGADAPENFLAYDGFDNTPDNFGKRKSWSPHVQDWNTGDVTWKGGKGKGIIGAVNYLSEQGLNVFSFLTMNIKGDDQNVFPYINSTDFTRIDVSKMDQWEYVFEHAQKMGMYLHFKMQEQETDQLLDGGALGTQRKLYCRELIARFSHHLALNWNLGEENTQTTQQRKDMAKYLCTHDPYKNNIVVHTWKGEEEEVYRPLLGTASELTGASLQTYTTNDKVYLETKKWVEASANAGKKWIVASDEQGAATTGVAADAEYTGNRGTIADNSESIRKDALWGNLMAGGAGVEYYFGTQTGETDQTCEDYRSRAKSWKYARYALEFFNTHLAFTELKPMNIVSTGWCAGKAGETYVLYLKSGGSSNITLPSGTYTVKWYNPRKGGTLQNGTVTTLSSGTVSVGKPPIETTSDWAVLITRNGGTLNNSIYQAEAYTAQSGTLVDKKYAGYTGTGYVDYGASGTWIEWNNVNASTASSAKLNFNFANGALETRQAAVTVNGVVVGNISFARTGSWSKWQSVSINASLKSGSNVIKVSINSSAGGPNLDRLEVSSSAALSNAMLATSREITLYNEPISNAALSTVAGAGNAISLYKKPSSNEALGIYPNPTSGLVNIVTDQNKPTNINIYNDQGKSIYKGQFSKKNFQVNLSAFTAGNYYLQFEAEGKKSTRKVVLVK